MSRQTRHSQSLGPESRLSAKLRSAFNRVRGIAIDPDLSPYLETVSGIHEYRRAAALAQMSDAELRGQFQALAGPAFSDSRAPSGPSPQAAPPGFLLSPHLDASARTRRARRPDPVPYPHRLVVEGFACIFEASRRALGLVPHDVQLIAGLAMCGRRIAELPTGEGKTLAAVFPAGLAALSGRGVHILTFNDYLACRDAAWMGPVYRLLGLSVGSVQEGMAKSLKRAAYAADVTYSTAKEAGFDYLRDGLAYDPAERVHRPFHMALVDEADSILIDEARIPLVISGLAGASEEDADRIASAVRELAPGRDYETDAERRNVFLTDAGLDRIERVLGCANLHAAGSERLLAAVYCALHAEALLRRDVDYIVRGGHVELVDEFTGRVMDKRHWPDGLQAAVEAKEGVFRKSQGRVLGSIALQHFLRLYPRLCGMTATASPSAAELHEFYGLTVTVVPPDRPCIRTDHPDEIFTHQEAKARALVEEISRVHASGRPILVGTLTVRESEELAAALAAAGVPCSVLNAKNDELEAGTIAAAGKAGAVTISTNMAGRGTDIRLGGPHEEERDRVVELGGLYVIGTNRHESLRIDHQLRGRAGRQGDPGSSRFFISLEDDLFEKYGLQTALAARHRIGRQAGAIAGPVLRTEIVHVQKVIEGQNFDLRRSLWRFSGVTESQRRIVAAWRERILMLDSSQVTVEPQPGEILGDELVLRGRERFGPEIFDVLARRAVLFQIDRFWAGHLAALTDIREGIHLVGIGGKDPVEEFMRASVAAFEGLEDEVGESARQAVGALIGREGPIDLEAEGLRGPSSTWTYLVNDDQLGWGLELLKGRNIGFSALAASYFGPLFLLTLLLGRLKRRKRG